MSHVRNHNSTINLPCFTAHSARSLCAIASVPLRRNPPCSVITTTGFDGDIKIFGNRTVICMAKPRRVKMVAKQIRRELSDMLLTDQVLQNSVLPEAALGADRYLSSLTTISDVEVSADLQVAKVYVSVFGDERGKEVAIAGLKSKTKYVRSELGKRMKLRLTPEVRFIEDESLERGSRVITILDRLKAENEKKAASNDDDHESHISNDDVESKGDDMDDEGIIYVE